MKLFELIAAVSAGLSATFTTYLIVDFVILISQRYRERYGNSNEANFDDLFIQLPSGKIFEISILISSISALIGAAVLYFASGKFSLLGTFSVVAILAIVTFPLPKVFLKILRQKRLSKFNLQLEDALSSMSSSLKAGFSINQAVDEIAKTNIRPISIEFRLLMQEIRLGVSMENALHQMSERLNSPDFELVATAIITARQTGGELTSIFDRLANMIRERNRINNKLKAITSMGKLQAYIIGFMPLVLLLVIGQIAPAMLAFFFQTLIGIILLMVCIILVITGFFWIKKILTIDI